MPFPAAFPTVLNADLGVSAALVTAMGEAMLRFPQAGAPHRAAISLVAINDATTPPTFGHGGVREGETHYSASLLKVAAMYAAFQLRQSVNAAAASTAATTSAQLYAGISASLDPLIRSAVPLIAADPQISDAMKVPSYPSIFAAIPLTTGGFALEFSADFSTQMRQMIVDSSNPAAQACVQRLGYSWLNGALAAGGFFHPATQSGMWLAGTFTGSWPSVRIPSVNDGLVAQAMTTFDAANLYALMVARMLVDAGSCERMLTLLADAVFGPDPSWITRSYADPDIGVVVTHTKIGLGPLKPQNGGFDVASEGTVVHHVDTGSRYIAVWQNSRNDLASLQAMSFIIDRAISIHRGAP